MLMVRFMASDAAFVGPLNMGNPDERNVLEVAELILELTGSRSRIVTRALPTDDPVRRCPDISLARERLDWQPTTPLREGLAVTIAYFEERVGRGAGARSTDWRSARTRGAPTRLREGL